MIEGDANTPGVELEGSDHKPKVKNRFELTGPPEKEKFSERQQPLPTLEETLEQLEAYLRCQAESGQIDSRAKAALRLFKLVALSVQSSLESQAEAGLNPLGEAWERYCLQMRLRAIRNQFPILLERFENEPVSSVDRTAYLIYRTAWLSEEIDKCSDDAALQHLFDDEGLDPSQYRNLFKKVRQPGKRVDRLVEKDGGANYVAVFYQGLPYKVIVKKNNKILKPEEIKAQLNQIISNERLDEEEGKQQLKIGKATQGLERRDWRELKAALPADYRDQLDNALFVVGLDSIEVGNDADLSKSEATKRAMQGLRSVRSNRWSDQTVQLIIDDLDTGFIFEHSNIDGLTALRFASRLHQLVGEDLADHVTLNEEEVEERQTSMIELGSEKADKARRVLSDLETSIDNKPIASDLMVFNDFGEKFISQFRRSEDNEHKSLSSDAFFQLVLQLALSDTLGQSVSVVEPLNTRWFKGGRLNIKPVAVPAITELIREMKKFKAANIEPHEDKTKLPKLAKLIQEAVTQHLDQVKQSKFGVKGNRATLMHLLAVSKALTKGNISTLLLESLFGVLSDDIANIVAAPVVASNGSCDQAVSAFGTMGSRRKDALSVGYMIADNSITVEIAGSGEMSDKVDELNQNIGARLKQLQKLLVNSHAAGCLGKVS